MIKKIWGFTLSEILIALAVIGVVAVLVLPQLVVGQKAAQSKLSFVRHIHLWQKLFADMDSDDIDTDPSKYPTRTFILCLRIITDLLLIAVDQIRLQIQIYVHNF